MAKSGPSKEASSSPVPTWRANAQVWAQTTAWQMWQAALCRDLQGQLLPRGTRLPCLLSHGRGIGLLLRALAGGVVVLAECVPEELVQPGWHVSGGPESLTWLGLHGWFNALEAEPVFSLRWAFGS